MYFIKYKSILFNMESKNHEKKEIYTVKRKSYTVIAKVTDEKLSKENLIKLIVQYGLEELQREDY